MAAARHTIPLLALAARSPPRPIFTHTPVLTLCTQLLYFPAHHHARAPISTFLALPFPRSAPRLPRRASAALPALLLFRQTRGTKNRAVVPRLRALSESSATSIRGKLQLRALLRWLLDPLRGLKQQ